MSAEKPESIAVPLTVLAVVTAVIACAGVATMKAADANVKDEKGKSR